MKLDAKRVCFVTDEFFPVKPGGIGRLLFNLLSRRGDGAPIYILLVDAKEAEIEALNSIFAERIVFRPFRFSDGDPIAIDAEGRRIIPIAGFEGATSPIANSNAIMFALLRWQRELGNEFDIIEFPDFRGWGFSAIAAKRCGLYFQGTRLTVRLHSAESLIEAHEPNHLVEDNNLDVLRELERLAIRDADLVIAHLPGVRDLNRQHFRLPETWLDTCLVQPPPVTPLERRAISQRRNRSDLVFSTRLVPFKNAELFIRACAQHFMEHPQTDLRAVIACDGWNQPYVDSIKALVPEELRSRFAFLGRLKPEERATLIESSIFVITSLVESFCLAAYEASLAGAVVVLNADCVAFGEASPWRHGVNCIKYRGGTLELSDAIARALAIDELEDVSYPETTPYFDEPTRDAPPFRGGNEQSRPRLSAIVHVDGNAQQLLPTLEALSRIEGTSIELILVEDGGRSSHTARLVATYRASLKLDAIHHIRLAASHGRLRSFAEGWRDATGDAVCFLEAGVVPDYRSFGAFTRALYEGRADAILPSAATFRSLVDHRARLYGRVALSIGGGWSLLGHSAMTGTVPPIVRRASFSRYPFENSVLGVEFIDFVEAAGDERRIVGSPHVGIYVWNNRNTTPTDHGTETLSKALQRLIRYRSVRDGDLPLSPSRKVVSQIWGFESWQSRTQADKPASELLQRKVDLTISVCEPTSTSSAGREVWLFGARLGDVEFEHKTCAMTGEWRLIDGALVSSEVNASLTWSMLVPSGSQDPVRLTFLSHAWSGAVNVRVNNTSQFYDLFDVGHDHRTIEIPMEFGQG